MTTTLAIDGGDPVRTGPFPAWPIFGAREEELLLEVLHSGNWSELSGDKVATFARQFANFQGAEFGVCVPNGTLALELALQTLGVGLGDEIVTTAYTFIATASSAFSVGAQPIFVDIDPSTNSIDPTRIEAAITPGTKAIVPVHIGGQPVDMDGVMEIGRKHGIPVLEDACQAWGAAWRGTPVGAIGDMGCFSFQESKNISGGEGGIVVTNNRHHYNLASALHNVGRPPEGGWNQHDIPGNNLRMTEWSAAVLIAQLERLPEAMKRRQQSAGRLTAALADVPGLAPIDIPEGVTSHAWHLYQLRYDPASFGGKSRKDFIEALVAEGIPGSAGYIPLTHEPAIRNTLRHRFGVDSLKKLLEVPHAVHAGHHTVWLPQTMLLGDDGDMDQVADACGKIQRAWA